MIHWLRCLWWEWKWRLLKRARRDVLWAAFQYPEGETRAALLGDAARIEREIERLYALMTGRIK